MQLNKNLILPNIKQWLQINLIEYLTRLPTNRGTEVNCIWYIRSEYRSVFCLIESQEVQNRWGEYLDQLHYTHNIKDNKYITATRLFADLQLILRLSTYFTQPVHALTKWQFIFLLDDFYTGQIMTTDTCAYILWRHALVHECISTEDHPRQEIISKKAFWFFLKLSIPL